MDNLLYPSGSVSTLLALTIFVFAFLNGSPWVVLFPRGKFTGRIMFGPAIGVALIAMFFIPWSWFLGFGVIQSWSGLLVATFINLAIFKCITESYEDIGADIRVLFADYAPHLFVIGMLSVIAGSVDLVKFHNHGETFRLASPITDHVKVNIIQSFRAEGFPLKNPFANVGGEDRHFPYYFLWYMLAAVTSCLYHGLSSAWEGDMAMTIVTAFVSLLTILGLSVSLSRDSVTKRSSAWWCLLLSISASLLPFISLVITWPTIWRILSPEHSLETWLQQVSWVPQHMMAGPLVILSLLLTVDLGLVRTRSSFWTAIILIAILVSAGFGMSAWVGGFAFLLSAVPIALWEVARSKGETRHRVIIGWCAIGVCSAILAIPSLLSQMGAAVPGQPPIGIRPWPVLAFVPASSLLNHIAYWVLFLPLAIGGIYIPFLLSAKGAIRRSPDVAVPLVCISIMSLSVSWLMESRIANNDLGWRAVIPAILSMMAVAAAGLAENFSISAEKNGSGWMPRISVIPCIMLITASFPWGMYEIKRNVMGDSPLVKIRVENAYWLALRHTGSATDRVLTSPSLYRDAESWPVNVGGGLMTERKSCYLSYDYMRSFSAHWPAGFSDEVQRRITDFYNGDVEASDMRFLRDRLGCRVIGITSNEKVWKKASSKDLPFYHQARNGHGWIILIANDLP